MNAYQVKEQLSEQLRNSKQFVSAGVMQQNGSDYVLIRLLDKNFKRIKATIPQKVGNIAVKVEKSGTIDALDW